VNSERAKEILLLYRPAARDDLDPEMNEALRQSELDPELRIWLERHCALQDALREKLRGIQPPPGLRERLLSQQKIVRPHRWRKAPVWLPLAASVALVAGGLWLWWHPRTPDRFADYQSRMVRTVLREYRMDIMTQDLEELRKFLQAQGGVQDFALPAGLARLKLTGGGLFRWRNQPVSMACFDRGDKQMLFLFVLRKSSLKDAPPETPQTGKMNQLLTACWSRDDKTYLLAGPNEADFSSRYQ
jgi:hypothetical protein